jgi:cardiolipin synthase
MHYLIEFWRNSWPYITSALYFGQILICIAALFIVPVNRKPSSATAWLMLTFLVPYFGLVLFAILGSPKLPMQRRTKQRQMNEFLSQALAYLTNNIEQPHIYRPYIEPRFKPLVELNTNLGGLPACSGNRVELLGDYDQAIRKLAEDIENAKYYVNIEYYIFADDSVGSLVVDALIRAQQRGVICHVLADDIGNRPNNRQLFARLREHGIEAREMLPVRLTSREWLRLDLRNHRKIAVIDGLVGFTGSQNLIEKQYNKKKNKRRGLYYIELVARVQGPIVQQLNSAFITDWYAETDTILNFSENREGYMPDLPSYPENVLCQVLPSGPGFDNDNNLKLFVSLFHSARSSITIANPYFVPDDSLMTALTSAAQRGVDVCLIASEIGDQFLVHHAQRSYYEELLAAGVKVYLYHSPVLLHSKFMCIDDDICVIGSSNMDMRSFQLNLEISLVCYDQQVNNAMRIIFETYFNNTFQLDLEEWRQQHFYMRLFDNLARLTAALQ